MDQSAYAGLLAQVVPVVLLALIVELRGLHEVWMRSMADEPKLGGNTKQVKQANKNVVQSRLPNPMPVIVLGLLLIGFLASVEAAALIAAVKPQNTHASKFVNPEFVVPIMVGGFLLVSSFSAIGLAHSYFRLGAVSNSSRLALQWLIRFLVVAGLGATFWMLR